MPIIIIVPTDLLVDLLLHLGIASNKILNDIDLRRSKPKPGPIPGLAIIITSAQSQSEWL